VISVTKFLDMHDEKLKLEEFANSTELRRNVDQRKVGIAFNDDLQVILNY
jgi:hypothetical protein